MSKEPKKQNESIPMIELRWVKCGSIRRLEYRVLYDHAIDASNALLPPTGWSDWMTVPTVGTEEAAFQDLTAAGGLVEAQNKGQSDD